MHDILAGIGILLVLVGVIAALVGVASRLLPYDEGEPTAPDGRDTMVVMAGGLLAFAGVALVVATYLTRG